MNLSIFLNNFLLKDFIHPICIPSKEQFVVNEHTIFSVAGWGRTETGLSLLFILLETCPDTVLLLIPTESSSAVKMKAQLPFFAECQDAYKWKSFSQEQFCAGGGDEDSCRGDSGAPLILPFQNKWFAYGIVSHGPNRCGTIGKPGIYTNVTFYKTWIENVVINESG